MSEAFTEKFISTRTLALESKDFSPLTKVRLLLREEVILKGPCCEGTISKKGLDSVTSELIFRTTAELSALYTSGVKDSTDWSR